MTAIKIKDLGKKVMDDYNAAMANPSTEYERGFVDGAQHQMKSSVDKAVNRMAQTEHEPWLLESTQTLAKTLAREFYPEVTQWKCLNDLAGVISQIDNMTTGLMRKTKQEPVAWHTEDHLTDRSATTYSKDMVYRWQSKGWPVTPLYALPPQRTWVGLTGEEIINISCGDLHYAALIGDVVRKLKEKNT